MVAVGVFGVVLVEAVTLVLAAGRALVTEAALVMPIARRLKRSAWWAFSLAGGGSFSEEWPLSQLVGLVVLVMIVMVVAPSGVVAAG